MKKPLIRRSVKAVCSILICTWISSIAIAQTPNYISLYEVTTKDHKIELKKGFHIIDINSQVLIEFKLDLLKQQNVQVALSVFAKRGANVINLPDKALSQVEIFPNTDPQDQQVRNQFVMSGNDSAHKEIVLDLRSSNVALKTQGKDLQEYDHLFIKFSEIRSAKEFSVELELVEIGLSGPSEIAAPLMVFKAINKDSPLELGLGLSGILHFKTRKGLQDYLGFGITITPTSISLDDLKNSHIGILPTVSIGLGRKNQDIFLLGAGYQIGFDRCIWFIALNGSWIGRLLK